MVNTKNKIIKANSSHKRLMKIVGCLLGISLSGCSAMNGNFDCNKVGGKGAGCVSMDEVNQMTTRGAFNSNHFDNGGVVKKSRAQSLNQPKGYSVETPMPGAPIWHEGDLQQIWIAPWVDREGNYHEPSYVYFKATSGHWIGVPPEAVVNN